MNEVSDVELIHKFLNGDVPSFELLVKRYQGYVYNVVIRMTGNVEDAKDLTEEIFIKIYSLLKNYDIRHKFSSWLYKIVVNYVIDFERKNRKIKNIDTEEKLFDFIEKISSDTEKKEFEEEDFKRVYVLLNNLKPVDKQIVILKYIEGLSFDEISEILSMNPATVRTKVFRAINFLRKKVENTMKQKEHFLRINK